MNLFTQTDRDEARFAAFSEKINKTLDTLSPFADLGDLSPLKRAGESFRAKTADFYRNDRKLNIGVIGQVKAGKSSFLNTLLFDGRKVLPSAATPKTATLTKIEYGEENTITVEYYAPEEWEVLEKNALVDSKESEFESAREIMGMIAENGIDPAEYTTRGSECFTFDSVEKLMPELNGYVGENGRFTPLVKNVTIRMTRDELKDISVVDTPGLNDAIASRTDKTREFIEKCDVVFFLSRASQFLDKNDIRLVESQLPQKGVEKIIMVCSRFDDGISDIIEDYDDITEAVPELKKQLTAQAVKIFKSLDDRPELAHTLEQCKKPVFISSMCQNMSAKDPADYDAQENNVFSNLNENDDVTPEILAEIGNMSEVRSEFDSVVTAKDETLSAKARNFLPNAEKEYAQALTDLKNSAEKTREILNTGDQGCEQLAKEKKAAGTQINAVRGSIEAVFGEMLANLERAKGDTLRQLREASRDAAQLRDKTETETHVSSYKVSDSKWYKPSTWGKSHTEYSTYESTYTYVDASDALENIRSFSSEACSDIEKTFYNTVDVTGTKRKLLTVVVDNFDTSSEMYDPALFRLITEKTPSEVQFPVIKIDVSKEQATVSANFSGEIRNSRERSELRTLLSNTIGTMLDAITDRFTAEVSSFRSEIERLKSTFSDKLIENIQADFDRLTKLFEDSEQKIRSYDEFIKLIDSVRK